MLSLQSAVTVYTYRIWLKSTRYIILIFPIKKEKQEKQKRKAIAKFFALHVNTTRSQ